MLSLTSDAAEVVSTEKTEQGVPEAFGLRVFPNETPRGVEVQLAFVAEPDSGDQVYESEGQRLFVAPELTEPLADAVLDATTTPDGAGLVLKQPGETGAS